MFVRNLFKDMKFGTRALAKHPGSAIISVLAFGFGIGLTTITFSLIYGVFFRGLPVPEPHQISIIFRNNVSENVDQMRVPQHDYFDWREQQKSFEDLGAYFSGTVNISGTEGPQRFNGGFVTPNTFSLLRVQPVAGTSFRLDDGNPGAPLTVVLGYKLWQTRFEADSAIAGRTIKVNGEQATILGVMAKGFMFPADQELWVAIRDDRTNIAKRDGGQWMTVFGRLNEGVSRDRAELEMGTIAARLAQEYPETNKGVSTTFRTFVEDDAGPELIALFGAMQVATIFVLLIACANVANILLARATLRTKEAAVRSAIGGSRLRVMLPFFSEAVVLSLAGALLGLAIAYFGIQWFDNATEGVGKPYYMKFAIDLPIMTFVVGITVLTAIVAGAAPAFQISRTNVNSVLKDEARGSSSFHGARLSKVLVVGEIALSCALLVGAGLMVKSIVQLRNYDFSFDTENVFTARIGLFQTDYPDSTTRGRFYRDLLQRLQSIPGSESVALTNSLPGPGSGRTRFAVEGETYTTDQDYPRAYVASVTPDFLETFGVKLVSGRKFTLLDDADGQNIVIVNRSFAANFFPGQDPIGRRIKEGVSDSEREWKTIVGVAPDLKMEGFDTDASSPAGYYVPIWQRDRRFMSIAINTRSSNPLALTQQVRAAIATIDPDLPIYNVYSLDRVIRNATWFYNVFGILFIVFGLAALFMASVGLYGVLAFSVSRRTQEMGIRMALGASARDVIRLILRQGLVQMAIGLTLGLGMAFGLSNIVRIVMFEVDPRDPSVFGIILFVVVVVSVMASLIPARRATRVDPMIAMRCE